MPFLSGIWSYLIAGIVSAGLAAGVTYYVTSLPYKLQIANLEKAQAQQNTASVQASIVQLQGFIKNITSAGLAYEQDRNNLDAALAKIHGDFANVAKATPLPVDCKPDAGRMHDLAAAVAAANAATGVGVGPRPALPRSP